MPSGPIRRSYLQQLQFIDRRAEILSLAALVFLTYTLTYTRYRRYPSLSILLTYSSCTKFESVEENLLNESVAPHSFPGAAVRRDDHQFCVLQRRRHQRNRNHLLPNWAAVLWVCVCQPIFLSVGRRKRHLCICHVVGRSRTLSNC